MFLLENIRGEDDETNLDCNPSCDLRLDGRRLCRADAVIFPGSRADP